MTHGAQMYTDEDGDRLMENINARIRELNLRRYGEDVKIIYGGICNEATYLNDRIRTLFILKEAHVKKDEVESTPSWSLPDQHLRLQISGNNEKGNGASMYRIWKNVARWISLVHNPNENFVQLTEAMLRGKLEHAAIVNIKKEFGNPTSDYKELIQYARDDRNSELLRKEIELIDPQFVVCGGTYNFVKAAFDMSVENVNADEVQLRNGAWFFRRDGRAFLGFSHPAYISVSDCILFAWFKDTFRALSDLMGW